MEQMLGRATIGNVVGEIKSDIGTLVRLIGLRQYNTKRYPCDRIYYVSLLNELIRKEDT